MGPAASRDRNPTPFPISAWRRYGRDPPDVKTKWYEKLKKIMAALPTSFVVPVKSINLSSQLKYIHAMAIDSGCVFSHMNRLAKRTYPDSSLGFFLKGSVIIAGKNFSQGFFFLHQGGASPLFTGTLCSPTSTLSWYYSAGFFLSSFRVTPVTVFETLKTRIKFATDANVGLPLQVRTWEHTWHFPKCLNSLT